MRSKPYGGSATASAKTDQAPKQAGIHLDFWGFAQKNIASLGFFCESIGIPWEIRHIPAPPSCILLISTFNSA